MQSAHGEIHASRCETFHSATKRCDAKVCERSVESRVVTAGPQMPSQVKAHRKRLTRFDDGTKMLKIWEKRHGDACKVPTPSVVSLGRAFAHESVKEQSHLSDATATSGAIDSDAAQLQQQHLARTAQGGPARHLAATEGGGLSARVSHAVCVLCFANCGVLCHSHARCHRPDLFSVQIRPDQRVGARESNFRMMSLAPNEADPLKEKWAPQYKLGRNWANWHAPPGQASIAIRGVALC